MKKILLILIFPFFLFSQEDNEGKDKPSEGIRGHFFKDREKRVEKFKQRLKESDPEKYAELEKLKQENPEKFREEMRRYMLEKMGMPSKDRAKKGNKGHKEHHWMRDLRDKSPERFEELMKLRKEDPEAFRGEMAKEFSDRMKRKRPVNKETAEKIKALLTEYHSATDEKKLELKGKVKETLAQSFKEDLDNRRQMATRLEEQLKEVTTQIEQRESNQDKLIEQRLDFLLNSSAFKKDKPKD
ncbi:MAG: hypothetical protein NE334_07290 [Lentisphaeraceae bacterium]|nr:hypothetical protein [Lentisphaeraceae bacterium]